VMNGGAIPIGLSTFCCSAESSCGADADCCWTVTVSAAQDSDCLDADDCTVDSCDPEDARADAGGCVHDRQIILYADLVPSGGDGLLDIDDLAYVLAAFTNPAAYPDCDIAPCGGDGLIDVEDLTAALSAFAGESMCSHPCPP